MKKWFPILCLSSFLTTMEADSIRALMITGGCCHDYENQKTLISEGVSARARVEWTILHEGGTDRNHEVGIYRNKDWAASYDVVVHNECFGGVTDVSLVEGIAKAHEEGLAAVMLHCSAHSYRNAKTDEWRKTMGISSYSHERRRDFEILNLHPDHPVMAGFPETWLNLNDELYKQSKLWPNAIPLANAYGKDTEKHHTVVWLNTHGRGRVFATTLGHGNETMRHPIYLNLVTRGLLWTVDQLDEDGRPKEAFRVEEPVDNESEAE